MLKVMDPMALSKQTNSDSEDDGEAAIHESWKRGPVHYLNRGQDGQVDQIGGT